MYVVVRISAHLYYKGKVMGRRPKYPTYKMYKPFIDIIRADLNILPYNRITHEGAYLDFNFYGKTVYETGSSYFSTKTRYGYVNVSKYLDHMETLETLAHELKHIQQYYTGRLIHLLGYNVLWENQVMRMARPLAKDSDIYDNSPWEIEATAYAAGIDRLFPQGRIQSARVFMQSNASNTLTFYKLIKDK